MSFFGGRKSQSPKPTSSFPPPPAAVLPRQPAGFETVLGAGSVLKGDLKCQGNIRMDGTFEGTLQIEGNVLVGEAAKITADISAKSVSIAGAVRGNVSGKKVQLLRTARVWGDITSSAISTEEGAFIDGKISMIVHDTLTPPEPSPDTAEPPDSALESAPSEVNEPAE
ncbi:MAG: polymer-forming cytoskeletal protein [Chloroflexi bacterium]|nr:polymer-forming cytoskeletal protein [Chloroflexota bacterium]